MARDAYLAIGREYGVIRRRPMPTADFADFGSRVLDVGAGSGAQPAYLEHEHPYVVHRDLDGWFMPPPGDSVECEATMLAFRDGAFDVAYLVAVIHHMPPPAIARALSEAKRVARRAVAARQPDRGREVAPGVYEVPWAPG